MAKRATAFELTLLPRDSAAPTYRWLYASVRTGILDGRIRPGTRLPASRDLASRYGISRGTVISAFEQLRAEGYLEGRIGSGTFVSRILPDHLFQVEHELGSPPALSTKLNRRLSGYGQRLRQFPNFQIRPTRAFRANLPALDLFPTFL